MAYLDALFPHYYMEYASYVIKDRAIPHIDDGLKPVQRRILHSLFDLDDGRFHKVANVVGHTMKFHPHGDQSIYDALVVLANKDLFIEKQGNFGNIFTGDPASAARYIECRLTPLARDTLHNPSLTDYEETYDGRSKEPVVFPAKIPVLLAQGVEGIAVGMATRMMPHNLIELLEAEVAYLQDRPFQIFPDFPTGGLVDIGEYEDGRGKVLVRARLDTSDPKRIIVRDIPFNTSTESLIASVEDAAKKNKVKIASIHDYTAEKVEIEIRLARGTYAEEVVDALFAFTDCELSISLNPLIIKDERPQIMGIAEMIPHSVDRLVDILIAELRVEEKTLQDRLHAKTLEQLFIEHRVYKAIEEMTTAAKVTQAVLKGLAPYTDQLKREVTSDDVDTLLKIPIRRISLYDINKAEKEMREIRSRLREIGRTLENIIDYAVDYLEGLIEKYRDQFPRRTEIVSFEKVDVRQAAKRDHRLCYDKKTGYLGYTIEGTKQLDVSTYDRVLVVRKDGTYSVIDVPDKLFVGQGMLYCGFIDKDLVFNILYKDAKGYGLIKRCCIEQFILNRAYSFVPEDGKLLKFTTDSDRKIALEYKPKPRLRILHEEFAIADYPVRGLRAGGIRLAPRELQSGKLI
ncbi:MAG: DNA topoisomerase IV subunit A [Candidatus Latescibacteria bacterium]|nr:DNA topoisomerase IV subunit A [Candidatus Latescibacterota bacterium]